MSDTSPALLGSYKAKIFFLTALLALVPPILVFVLALAGKATVDQVIHLSQWAMGALGISSTGTIIGRALEGMAEKGGPKNVTAGGDVIVTPSAPPPALQTPEVDVPAVIVGKP